MSLWRSGKARRGMVARLALTLAAIVAATLVASPASAASWTYDLKTTDGDPGGRTYGTVYYAQVLTMCYKVGAKGYVDDREADGYGVIVYLRARDCQTGRWTEWEAGYIGGADKPVKEYDSGYKYGYYAATAKICLYKNGKDSYCRTA